MAGTKKYWVGLEELHETESFDVASKNEFAKDAMSVDQFLGETPLSSTSTNRRDFLKFLGFGVTAATLAACETPVIKSIPYVNKPESITPGIPTYYASTYYSGSDYAGILVKTREGRPIYIKGNSKNSATAGAVNARINSSVLSLYDSSRTFGPHMNGSLTTWSELDSQLGAELTSIASKGGNITLLTETIISPSTNAAIRGFTEAYGENVVNTVTYDALSAYGIRKANERSFGKSMIPDYDFSKARVIVSIAADFMNNWLFHNQYIPQYARNRNPKSDWMSRHFHFETALSLTGSNADERFTFMPSQEGRLAVALHNEVARRTGGTIAGANTDGLPLEGLARAAEALVANRGESLVIAGSNNPDVQVVINAINDMLGNYGSTISTDVEAYILQGNDQAVAKLVDDMNAGRIDALLITGVNPAYSLPNAAAFRTGLKKVATTVSFSSWADETAVLCKYHCPQSHYLESWNDYYPKTGHYALAQPVITKLYDTRQFQENMLIWAGNNIPYHDFIKAEWQSFASSMGSEAFLFDDFWFNALRNGSVNVNVPASLTSTGFDASSLGASVAALGAAKTPASGFEVVLYTKVGMGDGAHAVNPWLLELPDPISKITWDNYIAMNPADAKELGFNIHYGQEEPATLAKISVGNVSYELPVIAQPGQKKGSVSIALGYGRGANSEVIGRSAYRTGDYGGYEMDDEGNKIPIGANVYPLIQMVGGAMTYHVAGAQIENTGRLYPIASTQTHHTLMGRDSVVKETTFETFKSAPKEIYNPSHTLAVHEDGKTVQKNVDDVDLWEEHPVMGVGHRWGMSIDLSTCIGCSACVTACHSENNVPVVGKDEIRRSRDMHWLRIDRYFSSPMSLEEGAEEGKGIIETYSEMEVPEYDNPATVYMPMMCQHCNHAPCETVCPVAATTHSNEGLNQMTYNRCIGTRYCANNCPYKVRRFNWFNYKAYDKFTDVNPSQDATARMVLNPDVTVRSRGVMEKCSMCVQRIQAGKLEAKMKSMPVSDGLIITACAEACPTNAIQFGDLNDSKSRVAEQEDDLRTYHALAEIGVKPSISYKVKVRNA